MEMTMLGTAEIEATTRAGARQIGPHSAPHTLAKLDRRTRESRLLCETRAELIRHVGNNPSAVQLALIEQAAQLRLRLACMDRRFAEAGMFTEHDSRVYLAWSNSYTRALRVLGLKGAPERPMSLAEHLQAMAMAAAAIRAPTAPGTLPGHTTIPRQPEAAGDAQEAAFDAT
jgi:hypothetical protein